MHVYFVRHGRTHLNAKNIHQSPNTPLSGEGREDVLTVAEHLREVNPDVLLSSEYTRARETARIIGLHVGITPQVHELFYEIMRPSKLFGESHFSIETLWYVFLSVLNRKKPEWRYTDAENFTDISNRAKKALAYLESLHTKYNSIVVVSHTIFINTMVSYMCRQRMLDVRDLLLTFLHIERMENTGIIHVEYTPSKEAGVCMWRQIDEV